MEAKQIQPCRSCGAIHGTDTKFCTECGSSLQTLSSPRISQRARQQNDGQPIFEPGNSEQNNLKIQGHVSFQSVVPQDQGPLCPKCQQIGVVNTAFCIHCGTPYSPIVEEKEHIHSVLVEEKGASGTQSPARLIMTDKSGTATQTFPLNRQQVDLGSKEGEIILHNDPYISPRHARFLLREGTYVIQDLESLNGVYQRVRQPWQLQDGDFAMLGQQVLRLEILPKSEQCFQPASIHGIKVFGSPLGVYNVRLVRYTVEGIQRDVYYLKQGVTTLGREGSDIVFHDDPYLSRQHAMIRNQDGKVILEDMNSSNGTSLRIRHEQALQHGDQLRIGKHLFRFEMSPALQKGTALQKGAQSLT